MSMYRLTQGAFVLMGGRLGAVYGHKITVIVAGVLWVIFHLVSGFMKSVITLSVMRGLSGIGGALIVPNAIAMLTITFPPGKMRAREARVRGELFIAVVVTDGNRNRIPQNRITLGSLKLLDH
jgi:MFS family permease